MRKTHLGAFATVLCLLLNSALGVAMAKSATVANAFEGIGCLNVRVKVIAARRLDENTQADLFDNFPSFYKGNKGFYELLVVHDENAPLDRLFLVNRQGVLIPPDFGPDDVGGEAANAESDGYAHISRLIFPISPGAQTTDYMLFIPGEKGADCYALTESFDIADCAIHIDGRVFWPCARIKNREDMTGDAEPGMMLVELTLVSVYAGTSWKAEFHQLQLTNNAGVRYAVRAIREQTSVSAYLQQTDASLKKFYLDFFIPEASCPEDFLLTVPSDASASIQLSERP